MVAARALHVVGSGVPRKANQILVVIIRQKVPVGIQAPRKVEASPEGIKC